MPQSYRLMKDPPTRSSCLLAPSKKQDPPSVPIRPLYLTRQLIRHGIKQTRLQLKTKHHITVSSSNVI